MKDIQFIEYGDKEDVLTLEIILENERKYFVQNLSHILALRYLLREKNKYAVINFFKKHGYESVLQPNVSKDKLMAWLEEMKKELEK